MPCFFETVRYCLVTRFIIERLSHDGFAVLSEGRLFENTGNRSLASKFSEADLAQFWLESSGFSRTEWTVNPVEEDILLVARNPMLRMATNTTNTALAPDPQTAAEYRVAYRNRLMVFTKIKGATPKLDEFCSIRSVETLSPNLWITGAFLDGSKKGFRPEKIRLATTHEVRLSEGLFGKQQT